MTIERLFPSGAYAVSTIRGGRYFRRTYYGYTRREAVQEFRAYVREARREAVRELRAYVREARG